MQFPNCFGMDYNLADSYISHLPCPTCCFTRFCGSPLSNTDSDQYDDIDAGNFSAIQILNGLIVAVLFASSSS